MSSFPCKCEVWEYTWVNTSMISIVTADSKQRVLTDDFAFFLMQGDKAKVGDCIKIEVLGRFRAVSYDDMMKHYHNLMNYEEYIPIEDGDDDAEVPA